MQTLNDKLTNTTGDRDDLKSVIGAIADAAIEVAALIQRGALAGDLGGSTGGGVMGEQQKLLDVEANRIFLDAMRQAPVALFASEENEDALVLSQDGTLAVAIDPLDGSSNINNNISIGTIFSVLPAGGAASERPASAFFQPGRKQLAAGFIVYGPQTAMVFTTGSGSHIATLDPTENRFVITAENVRIRGGLGEFAINASNKRFWGGPIRTYVADCQAGADGPRGRDYNMRWIASMVADAFRILSRGGVFLYPADARKGYANGRLRLVYEALPIAMVIEQAGGCASDGLTDILDKAASSLHERTPLIFGDAEEVECIVAYHARPYEQVHDSPLFADRGLFRA